MKKLYVNSLSKILTQLKLNQNNRPSPQELNKLLRSKYQASLKVTDLVRLPNFEVRAMLKIPCPITSLIKEQIQLCKILRKKYNIQQQNVCQKCVKETKCPFKGMPPQYNQHARLSQFIYFMMQLAQCKQTQYSILRWSAAFKTAQSLRIILANPQNIKKQSLLYKIANQPNQMQENQAKKNSKKQNEFNDRRFHL